MRGVAPRVRTKKWPGTMTPSRATPRRSPSARYSAPSPRQLPRRSAITDGSRKKRTSSLSISRAKPSSPNTTALRSSTQSPPRAPVAARPTRVGDRVAAHARHRRPPAGADPARRRAPAARWRSARAGRARRAPRAADGQRRPAAAPQQRRRGRRRRARLTVSHPSAEVVEIARGHHPDDQLLRAERRLARAGAASARTLGPPP